MKITSTENLVIELHSPTKDVDGWVTDYYVTLTGQGFSASIKVINYIYGQTLVDFLQELIKSPNGWQSEKTWGALEGEFALLATSDNTGHITLTAELRSGNWEPFWSAQVVTIIELGQLSDLLEQANSFFYPNKPS